MFPLQHPCRSQQRIHRHHASAADAGHIDRIAIDTGSLTDRLLKDLPDVGKHRFRPLLGSTHHVDRHKRWAIPLETGVVFVAGGLVDLCLAAELGIDGLHRQAVGFGAAIPTPLAHRLIDDHVQRGFGELAPLAMAAFLGGTLLVIDQHRRSGDLA
jgi:hypothetical protein